jgi:hypothetical protein
MPYKNERLPKDIRTWSIYSITCIVTNKKYIGISHRPRGRWSAHKSELKYSKHHNYQLIEDYLSYGLDSLVFEILKSGLRLKDAEDQENSLVMELLKSNLTYNIAVNHDQVTYNPNKEQICKKRKDRKVSKHTRNLLSKIFTGRSIPKNIEISIDNILYKNQRKAALALGIHSSVIFRRLNSPKYPNYFYTDPRKCMTLMNSGPSKDSQAMCSSQTAE